MTKVIILGEETPITRMKIEFVKFLNFGKNWTPSTTTPSEYGTIVLICRNYGGCEHDLMFAYYTNKNEGLLYLGYFNDGIV